MLTATEIAAFLGVTPGYVRRLIAEKGIVAIGKRGRAHLFDINDILRHTGVRDRVCVSA